ncbi:MAG: hypothetical protein ABI646_09450, partial [Acidobacteriota bacterium]
RGFDEVKNSGLEGIKEDDIWIAFRTSVDGEDIPLLDNFTKAGYRLCPGKSVKYDSTTVFWMKMTKSADGCR